MVCRFGGWRFDSSITQRRGTDYVECGGSIVFRATDVYGRKSVAIAEYFNRLSLFAEETNVQLSPTFDFEMGVLEDALASGKTLAGIKAGLTKTEIDFDPSLKPADVAASEADYAGYTRQLVTFNAPSISDAGAIEVVGTIPEFRPDDDTVDNQIFQLTLFSGDGTKLLAVAAFDNAPLPMGQALDAIVATVRVSVIPTGFVVSVS